MVAVVAPKVTIVAAAAVLSLNEESSTVSAEFPVAKIAPAQPSAELASNVLPVSCL